MALVLCVNNMRLWQRDVRVQLEGRPSAPALNKLRAETTSIVFRGLLSEVRNNVGLSFQLPNYRPLNQRHAFQRRFDLSDHISPNYLQLQGKYHLPENGKMEMEKPPIEGDVSPDFQKKYQQFKNVF